MKFHFEADLDYQREAIDSITDLFTGQEIARSEFTVVETMEDQTSLAISELGHGFGNQLSLTDEALLANLRRVQLRNGLAQSTSFDSRDFTVEMETGTGKTYVYLRTIFDLNERYGFSKFVIVVPSIAVKEGVHATLEATAEHFRSLYGGTTAHYFQYDSAKPGQVRAFARSARIQIMIVTVGAINKKEVNNLYKDRESSGGDRPIDLLQATQPIIIVDEPQSVDGGLKGKGRQALAEMKPLCTLRYSATHADKHHMVYRLDAVDAYQRQLVKQIEVAAATVDSAHNRPFVRLVGVSNTRRDVRARIEVDVQQDGGVRRKEIVVHDGVDLEAATGRTLYRDCRIGELRASRQDALLELRTPSGETYLREGESWGDVDVHAIQREMIRRTIREHLEKELSLRPRGIKVLTLFFIDAVDRYRQYDSSGNIVKGPYALMFEEEYARLSAHPDFQVLRGLRDLSPAQVHGGYFSIDKRGGWTNTAEGNQTGRENAERAYALIMREKGALLELGTPLSFIFSHSALREGWDNPNVFQLCTLRDIRTERERRQTIGRGLRLCVDGTGARVRDAGINILTVVAAESYRQFADALQKEIEADTGVRFGMVKPEQLATLPIPSADGALYPMGIALAQRVWEHLRDEGYLNSEGRVQDALRTALKDGTVSLPEDVSTARSQIDSMLKRFAGRIEIRNADERKRAKLYQSVLDSPEFRELWRRIRDKTRYRVRFDSERLISQSITALRAAPPTASVRLQWRKAELAIAKSGVETRERAGAATVVLSEGDIDLPNVLSELESRTGLTRRTLQRILIESDRLPDLRRNPQSFIEAAAVAINHCKHTAMLDGVFYQRLGDAHYYAIELFEQTELVTYLKDKGLSGREKCLYDEIEYDSDTERAFARQLELNADVKVFTKLPKWFKIATPIGAYNPDWAVVMEQEGQERLYAVVETKASVAPDDLRGKERAKIEYARRHYEAVRVLEPFAAYITAERFDDLLSYTTSAR